MSKEKQHIVLKKGLFVLILIILLLPIAQKQLRFFDIAPLSGAFVPKEKVKFSLNDWFEGNYQSEKEAYINEKFGFRNLCVRLNNQIAFSFFNYARANGVIIGKDNYLYEENYIKAYFGEDFIGERKIIKKVNKFKIVQDSLKANGIHLAMLLAPGKGSYYPEYFPKERENQKRGTTNYEVFLREFKKNNVNYLDFKLWFEQMKDTSKHVLFPKCGIHWSSYGEVLAADSLLKYIQSISDKPVPKIEIESQKVLGFAIKTDDDIEEGMNLLFDIKDLNMTYASLKKRDDLQSSFSTKVLTIADSYYWGMYWLGLSKNYFNNGGFWFYNEQVYPQSHKKLTMVDEINFKKEVEKHDVIVIMSTDANLYKFPFGAIDRLYDVFVLGNEKALSKKEKRTQLYIKLINESAVWLKIMKRQAKENKQSLEKEIRANAEFMVWRENNS